MTTLTSGVGVAVEGGRCAGLKFMKIVIFSITCTVERRLALDLLLDVVVSGRSRTRCWCRCKVGGTHGRDVRGGC